MTAVDQTSSPLMAQCLDFCQALALQGRVFKFSVTVGSDLTVSLDTKETRHVSDNKTKKRSSPSTRRRNAKRRAEFLSKKSSSEAAVATGVGINQKQRDVFHCDQCDSTFKTENGLKIHKGKSHKEDSRPEKVRNPTSQPALVCSPIKDATRVEPCHNCGMDMSLSHQCPSDQHSTVPGVRSCNCTNPHCCGCHHVDACECRQYLKLTAFCDCTDMSTDVQCNHQPKA